MAAVHRCLRLGQAAVEVGVALLERRAIGRRDARQRLDESTWR